MVRDAVFDDSRGDAWLGNSEMIVAKGLGWLRGSSDGLGDVPAILNFCT